MLPSFVVIGAQKAGSTFLLRCLADHPQLYMPSGETRFFEDPDYLGSDITALERLFHHVPEGKIVGIKRPDYLAKPECPARIHRHLPHAKLIVVLRDPVERSVSSYFYQMRQSFIPVRPPEQGLRSILAGEYRKAYPKAAEIVEYGFYHRHLSRYLTYFDRNQLLILHFRLIKEDPQEAVRRAYRFLDVDDRYNPQPLARGSESAANKGVYSLLRLRVLRTTNSLLFTYDRNRTRREPKPVRWSGKTFARTVTWFDRRILAPIFGNSKPDLSPELMRILRQTYLDDQMRLEALLGPPLNHSPAPDRRTVGA